MRQTSRPLTRKLKTSTPTAVQPRTCKDNYTRKFAILQVIGGCFMLLQQRMVWGIIPHYAVFCCSGVIAGVFALALLLHNTRSDDMKSKHLLAVILTAAMLTACAANTPTLPVYTQEEIDAIQSEKDSLQEALDSLQAEKDILQDDFDSLESEANELEEKNEALRFENGSLQIEIDELTAEKSAEVETSSGSSVPAASSTANVAASSSAPAPSSVASVPASSSAASSKPAASASSAPASSNSASTVQAARVYVYVGAKDKCYPVTEGGKHYVVRCNAWGGAAGSKFPIATNDVVCGVCGVGVSPNGKIISGGTGTSSASVAGSSSNSGNSTSNGTGGNSSSFSSGSDDFTTPTVPEVKRIDIDTQISELLKLTNEARLSAGSSELEADGSLMELAAIRAQELSELYSHTRPDGTTAYAGGRLANAENMYEGPTNAEMAIKGWLNSERHRKNMLNEHYEKFGVGCYQDEDGVIYWIQLFRLG